MSDPVDALTRVVEIHTSKAIREAYNSLELYDACAGIRFDWEEAAVAKYNHFGHPGFKGSWVPERKYITSAVGEDGQHDAKMPNVEAALRSVITLAIRNSIRRQQHNDGITYKSHGSNKAFGTTNSAKEIMLAVADQMLENQLAAFDHVMPENSKWTALKKKKRSNKPLVDYGHLRAANTRWVVPHDKPWDYGEEEE